MRIIKPDVVFMTELQSDEILAHIERCGRVCYKSEARIADGSAEKFVSGIVARGHEAVLEHVSATVKFICDRGVTHEIVRHRLAAYCQESTRYCNYSRDGFGNEITVIRPCYLEEGTEAYQAWRRACETAEESYFAMLRAGSTPQEARAVLPNSLKTELVMTADMREWRHFLRLRCSAAAHPQMREVAGLVLREFQAKLPVLFGDITAE